MFNKRTGISLMLALLAVVLIAVIWSRNVVNPQLDVSPELERFVAQAIIDDQLEQAASGYRSPEGAIVARVVTTTITSTAQLSVLQVWQFQQGQLVTGDTDSFFKALRGNRSDWPSFTYYFAFDFVTADEASVDVNTMYNMGLTTNSRGGNAQKWILEKHANIWSVRTKHPYMYWD
jgi:hypothetical protein